MDILIFSVIVYYIYVKLRSRENRILMKFQVVQLLIVKDEPTSQEDLLSTLILEQRSVNAQKGLISIQTNRLTQRVNTHLALGRSFEEQEN